MRNNNPLRLVRPRNGGQCKLLAAVALGLLLQASPAWAQTSTDAVLRVNPTAPSAATFRLPDRRDTPARRLRPARLRASEGLLVEVPDVNPFMHEVLIQGAAVTYTLAAPPVGEQDKTAKSGTPLVQFDRDDHDYWERLSKLATDLNSYLDVLEQLRLAYGANAWTRNLVEGWTYALGPAAGRAFGTATPSARQVAAWPDDAQRDVATLRQHLAESNAGIERKLRSLSDQAAKSSKAEDLKRDQTNLLELTANLDKLAQRLSRSLGATVLDAANTGTPADELLILGRVFVKLRERNQNPDQVTSQRLTADGDELDVTVTLKPMTGYQVPPAAVPAQTFTYACTLPVTQRFRVSVSAGVFVSKLVNHRFVLFEDSMQVGQQNRTGLAEGDTATVPGYRRMKRIGRENTLDRWDVGITTLTHFHYRLWPAFDVAASVGVGVQTAGVRALGGFSALFGGKKQRLCLTIGGIIGPVTRLSGGYGEGQLVPVGVSTVPVQTVNRTSGFVAASWNLTGTRE